MGGKLLSGSPASGSGQEQQQQQQQMQLQMQLYMQKQQQQQQYLRMGGSPGGHSQGSPDGSGIMMMMTSPPSPNLQAQQYGGVETSRPPLFAETHKHLHSHHHSISRQVTVAQQMRKIASLAPKVVLTQDKDLRTDQVSTEEAFPLTTLPHLA